jgi:hypothetical protein
MHCQSNLELQHQWSGQRLTRGTSPKNENLYLGVQKMSRIDMSEIRLTVGIFMYMPVVCMPFMRLFWKKWMNISAVSNVKK